MATSAGNGLAKTNVKYLANKKKIFQVLGLELDKFQSDSILIFRLSIRNVAYIGLRSVDRYERLVIEKFGITAFGMEDVERYGIHPKINNSFISNSILLYFLFVGIHDVVHMALDRIDPGNKKSLHVSFDIDSLDPLEAPSTGTPGNSTRNNQILNS